MRFRKAIVAAAGISMAASPVLAQSAAPLSIASSVNRAGASIQGASRLNEERALLPALVIMAILAAAILWTSNEDSDLPESG